MYNGFFNVFLGFSVIVLSFIRKNSKKETAGFFKKYNKQILFLSGIILLGFGTLELIESIRN